MRENEEKKRKKNRQKNRQKIRQKIRLFNQQMILLDLEKRPINRADWKKSDISIHEEAACRVLKGILLTHLDKFYYLGSVIIPMSQRLYF